MDTKSPTLASQDSGRGDISPRLMLLAVLSTVAASTCCVLPLALVLAGITGAWMTTLTALKPVTPVFTAIALAALAWAGWLVFRPEPVCDDGQTCAPRARLSKRVFLIGALLILGVLAFPLAAPWFY